MRPAFDLRNARDLVVLAVGGTYLQVIADEARLESQKTQVKYAQAVFDQSSSQLAAGTNTRIDVTRSRVQLQTEQERLIAAGGRPKATSEPAGAPDWRAARSSAGPYRAVRL